MSKWNHSMCDSCWESYNPNERQPVRIVTRIVEVCCYCQKETVSGIYVRDYPDALSCKGEHAEH